MHELKSLDAMQMTKTIFSNHTSVMADWCHSAIDLLLSALIQIDLFNDCCFTKAITALESNYESQ
jgi:hypothetical protein